MERFQLLFRVMIEHDYFNGEPFSSLKGRYGLRCIKPTRREYLRFRQMDVNKWDVWYLDNDTALEIEINCLELGLYINDPLFTLYTECMNICPILTYMLQLTGTEEEIDVMSAMVLSGEKRKMNAPFCMIRLPLTGKMWEAAKARRPESVILHFNAPSKYWEYLFLPRVKNDIPMEQLLLEDATGELEFTAFEVWSIYGQPGIRTISKEPIPMRATYQNRLCLVRQPVGGKQQKQILFSHIEPPHPGHFQSSMLNALCRVCYY